MKEVIISNSERAFITDVIANKQRLDGRELDQFRKLKINFGAEWGSVHVSLGETRVLAQVSCVVAQPKATRPTEGLLFLKVELGPMAAPHFETNRPSDLAVQVNRILERAFKDSNCVDLESLCIVADEKVWNLKVDLNVLNHEGNLIDCASVAVLAALAHFKRPDVTTSGDEVIIHTAAQKDPIPIVLHHYPVCVSYAIFQNGNIAIADPTALEERVAEANLVFGLNSYRELCGLHFGGVTMTSSQLLLKCATRGAKHAMQVVVQVKEALRLDEELRAKGETASFTECVRLNRITSLAQDRLAIRLKRFKMGTSHGANPDAMDSDDEEEEEVAGSAIKNEPTASMDEDDQNELVSFNKTSAALVPQKPKWVPESDFENSDDSEEMDEDEDMEPVVRPEPKVAPKKSKKKEVAKQRAKPVKSGKKAKSHEEESSEEEETVVMASVD